MIGRPAWVALMVAAVVLGTAFRGQSQETGRFDHLQHRRLFPSCTSCHAGIQTAGASIWPAPEGCAGCHDGRLQKVVDWKPPTTAQPSNLRFTHLRHAERVAALAPDSALRCPACHQGAAAPWMQVIRTASRRCLDCHGVTAEHLSAPDTACATCHLTLAQAKDLSPERVASFRAPESHRDPGFPLGSRHGHQAGPVMAAGASFTVAPSCATCHARDFCLECHVDAPEQPAIQALALDPRSLEHRATLQPPDDHHAPDFLVSHGRPVRRSAESCATCHTRESCLTCHRNQPPAVMAMKAAGPGRARGAIISRRRPASHGVDFGDSHASLASAAGRSCSTCHVRAECLECHRPSPASGAGYHPSGFLDRHPAAAYARESSCADCHNTAGFCATCHAQAGLTATRSLGSGFHDAKRFFLVGHGQAARQSLESCVACHTVRDCLTCHSANGGRNFDPHGPGFDAARLRRRNPEMCTVCHGIAIPQ